MNFFERDLRRHCPSCRGTLDSDSYSMCPSIHKDHAKLSRVQREAKARAWRALAQSRTKWRTESPQLPTESWDGSKDDNGMTLEGDNWHA